MFLVLAFIEDSWQPFFLCDSFELAPTLTGVEAVNSTAPLVVLQEGGREYFCAVAEFANGYFPFQK
jgi:hypothetical protein